MINSKTPTVQTKPARWLNPRTLLIVSLLSLALAACGGNGINRRKVEAPKATPQPAQIAQPQPQPRTQIVEVTRVVEVAQPAQVVEVTRIVEIVATATPDIQGFDMAQPAIDESAQPCPVTYWRNGRCVATQAQLDAYASEVQP